MIMSRRSIIEKGKRIWKVVAEGRMEEDGGHEIFGKSCLTKRQRW